jgi:hypothetical protein
LLPHAHTQIFDNVILKKNPRATNASTGEVALLGQLQRSIPIDLQEVGTFIYVKRSSHDGSPNNSKN